MGFVVDRVSEVLRIAANDIDDMPSFGAEGVTDYLLAVVRCDTHSCWTPAMTPAPRLLPVYGMIVRQADGKMVNTHQKAEP